MIVTTERAKAYRIPSSNRRYLSRSGAYYAEALKRMKRFLDPEPFNPWDWDALARRYARHLMRRDNLEAAQ